MSVWNIYEPTASKLGIHCYKTCISSFLGGGGVKVAKQESWQLEMETEDKNFTFVWLMNLWK